MMRHRLLILVMALVCVLGLGAEARTAKMMSVQVKESQLRATPSYLGKIVARASYGATVSVLEEKGDWKRVSVTGSTARGWLHASALTSKRIVLKAGQANVGSSVSSGEIALAGKGFSQEVETQYRKSHQDMDYTWINRMEAMKVSAGQMESFISGGRLSLAGEGGRP